MGTLGWVHTLFSFAALAVGGTQLLLPKGTPRHRRLGRAYVAAMAGVLITGMFIYNLTGTFGPFHAATIATAGMVAAAVFAAARKRPAEGWLERHYFFITFSYLGLVAATVSEIATRALGVRGGGPGFWRVAAVSAAVVLAVGGTLIFRRAGGILPALRRMRLAG
jgi:uncharacterized membrane protein